MPRRTVPLMLQAIKRYLEHVHLKQAFLLLSVCIGLEALVVLLLIDNSQIIGGDGYEYHRLAINLLSQHVFSYGSAPPYEPTTFRTPGYPVFIALVYLVSARSFLALRLVQFGIHLGTSY